MSSLIPIEHKNQRVLTTQQVADAYESDVKRVSENFQRNRDRYQLGIHYFKLEGDELREIKESANCGIAPTVNYFYLWTEKGALLHAKSLNTDKAWDVYNELVDTYFRKQQVQPSSVEDLIIMQAQSMKQLREEVKQLQSTTQTIKETIVSQPDNWREEINRSLNKISQAIGLNRYQEVRRDSYRLLDQRAGVDIERRLDNLRGRLLKQGKGKSAIEKANKLDCIEEDKKLREIYSKIINEYTIKYIA